MELKDQVCSLELAKRLKELGVKQESIFYWCLDQDDRYGGLPPYYTIQYNKRLSQSFYYPKDQISAFTVAELGHLLPSFIEIGRDIYNENEEYLWKIQFSEYVIFDSSLTNAMAKMLIFILENNLI
jgi:hypothetical protein